MIPIIKQYRSAKGPRPLYSSKLCFAQSDSHLARYLPNLCSSTTTKQSARAAPPDQVRSVGPRAVPPTWAPPAEREETRRPRARSAIAVHSPLSSRLGIQTWLLLPSLKNPSRRDIRRTVDGNACRCTLRKSCRHSRQVCRIFGAQIDGKGRHAGVRERKMIGAIEVPCSG